ncbi:unnamed protein product [Cuscuta campestris]|uniref:UBN2_2 domain-containing protein n=1 Tax=Cuscuta campestris TaxID=132261 RepID=A0A484KXX1_9ASTE|nr:unnamed protein product [Cuscuta campestris]
MRDGRGATEWLLRSLKNSIIIIIRGAIPDSSNAKTYLASVEEQFKATSKAHASTLILKMVTTKYDWNSGIREHIMMMNDMARKLKGLDMEISEGFLVHFIMTSLPASFEAFKVNYNTQKVKWSMNELIAIHKGGGERIPSPLLSQEEEEGARRNIKVSKILSEKRSSNFFVNSIHSSKEKRKNFNSIGETRRRNHHSFFKILAGANRHLELPESIVEKT